MSLSSVAKNAGKSGNKTIVCVCKVLDDERMLSVPKLTVCCLKIAESARKRILAAGGNVLTFDQLALKAPTGILSNQAPTPCCCAAARAERLCATSARPPAPRARTPSLTPAPGSPKSPEADDHYINFKTVSKI